MVLSHEEMEQRLVQLEAEVAALRRRLDGQAGETPADHGALLLLDAESADNRPGAKEEWGRMWDALGLAGEAPGIEKLRAMQAEQEKELAARQKASQAARQQTPPVKKRSSRRG